MKVWGVNLCRRGSYSKGVKSVGDTPRFVSLLHIREHRVGGVGTLEVCLLAIYKGAKSGGDTLRFVSAINEQRGGGGGSTQSLSP